VGEKPFEALAIAFAVVVVVAGGGGERKVCKKAGLQ